MVSEHEVTEQLITFLRGRSEHGQRKYGIALNPFDGRNTLMDALEEATDLSQYLMKRVMENGALADLLDRASDILEFFEEYYPGEVATYFHKERRPIDSGVLFETAAKLRADCERSVPVGTCACSPGDTCCCAYDCDCRERYGHEYQPNPYDEGWVNTGAIPGPTKRLAQMDHIPDATKKVVEYTWEQREALADRIAIRRRGGES